jgi:hypothetical protein
MTIILKDVLRFAVWMAVILFCAAMLAIVFMIDPNPRLR